MADSIDAFCQKIFQLPRDELRKHFEELSSMEQEVLSREAVLALLGSFENPEIVARLVIVGSILMDAHERDTVRFKPGIIRTLSHQNFKRKLGRLRRDPNIKHYLNQRILPDEVDEDEDEGVKKSVKSKKSVKKSVKSVKSKKSVKKSVKSKKSVKKSVKSVKSKKSVKKRIKKKPTKKTRARKKEAPPIDDPLRLFYESLHEENPDSQMAVKWLGEYSLL